MKNLLLLLLLSLGMSHALSSQTQHFQGTWTKLGTTYVFEFDLVLKHAGNQVEGYFNWKITRLDENELLSKTYYKDKIGLTAKEYVKGTYNPATKEYLLKGYKKDDPNAIIGLDTYRLKVDENGDLGGDTNANGSWKGRINGEEVKGDAT